MTYERDPVSIDDARAQAAERLLERKRMGLESAVEVLEVLGHRVVQRDDGTYAVRPPYVKPETEEEPLKPQTEAMVLGWRFGRRRGNDCCSRVLQISKGGPLETNGPPCAGIKSIPPRVSLRHI